MSNLLDTTDATDAASADETAADDQLVDVTNKTKGLFHHPVYITRSAWDDCVAWTEDDTRRTGAHENQDERLGKVLFRAYVALNAIASRGLEEVEFPLFRISTTPSLFATLSQAHLPIDVNATCPWPWSHTMVADTCTRCGLHGYRFAEIDLEPQRVDLKAVRSHNEEHQPVLVISLTAKE